MILNLTKVPMTNESPVVEVELHLLTGFKFEESFIPRLCERSRRRDHSTSDFYHTRYGLLGMYDFGD